MHSHVFRCRREIFPRFGVFDAQSSPQRVYQFESDGDVPHQFAQFVITHYESVLRQRVLPKFTGVVEKNSREQQVKVQLRVERCDLLSHAHHLCSMLDQSTAPRMMVIPRSRGAPKPVAPFAKKSFAQREQTWIADPCQTLLYEFEIGRLFGA